MKQISKLRINKERLVQSPKIKNVIWDTNNKVDEIVPKKEFDFEKAVVEDIAKLWDKDRIDAWKFYLNRDLSLEQQDAIIKAHNIWKDREWSWIYNYNQAEITEKARILKEAWFSKEERKVLLEKWVCGKEKGITKESKEYYTKLDRLWLTEDFIQSIKKSWIWGSEKLWIVERYERINKQISDYFDKQVKWEIKKEDYIDFKDFKDFINKRLEEINSKIKKWPKLTKTEANLIFSLTDNFIFNNLNTFLWWKWDRYEKLINLLKNKWWTEWVERLVNDIDTALNKMPNLEPWDWWFILRWDKIEFWRDKNTWEVLEVWDINHLKIFSFCANDIKDTFIWKNWKDTAVYVIWKEWRIKDITSLSLWVNFWWRVIREDILPRTYNEWIILRNSDLYIDSKENIWNTYRFNTTQIK